MNMTRILAQISPTLNGNLTSVPTFFADPLVPGFGAGAHRADAISYPSAGLMEQANAMAGRSPAQARQLRAGALAMLSVVR